MIDDERRKHDEQFRIRIIEQLAETKAIVTEGKDSLKSIQRELAEHGSKIVDVQHALWGGPGIGDIGLLEQHRRTVRNWAIFIWIGVGVVSFAGHLISPLYNKFIAEYLYNSVSEKWLREQNRPKVRKYVIHESSSESSP